MSTLTTKTVRVEALARVEGEGAFYVKVKEGKVVDAQLHIYEPPRFFEAFLRGRSYAEAPDITARICGICPVAYQMSAVHAMEAIFGVKVEGALRELRRLLYCGEWIESHALHLFMLHAPDFLGYADIIQMAADHPDLVMQALRIKKAGNDIVALLGGREIHPINVRVGGFYRIPKRREWDRIVEELKWARDAMFELVKWTGQLPFPDFEQPYEFVALRHPDEYPFNEGRLVSNRGLDIPIAAFEEFMIEEHLPHSTSLHARIKDRGAYFVGPLARYNLNFDRLSPLAQEAARAAGLGPTCYNPFQSIIVRGVETIYAIDEALRILETYPEPDAPYVPYAVRAGVGHGCTEAPRGILYHRYVLDDNGLIVSARITPPTAQNQATIEADLRAFVEPRVHLPLNELTWQCEQAIRNYDPCISCSTHFLRLQVEAL
ncbi:MULTISPECIES: Ni/Fe hydrogenase subunit alpha [Caldilinea]|uniref:Putative NiFe hydrogenase alpha subunit n=1 Tax=Caldilinea aerophila (strain DSM 14535 / JCM 11387 / NBRC 104270 / STL-6-O1) TaxID=926550 RepID=I0I3X8_CALAS|nr:MULTISPECIES: Ni/Fe hydrogenase subunit alpha [Caldilinea]BAL99965.1 putative NiFe hydrogenase alpha subunit [Caldilinea aerophila DSM 14535 = NBRC 104270]GIV73366.1 MAG: Ni/Fe hydrogenase subunit alpha [Caldilinea sp.]